jgi:hypothetical protein
MAAKHPQIQCDKVSASGGQHALSKQLLSEETKVTSVAKYPLEQQQWQSIRQRE